MTTLFFTLLYPTTTFALDIATLMGRINRAIINPVIILMFVVAVLIFLYGLVEFLAQANNEEIRNTGKRHMLWGIIGIAIMISVFGIMQLIISTLGVNAPGSSNPINLNDYRGKISK